VLVELVSIARLQPENTCEATFIQRAAEVARDGGVMRTAGLARIISIAVAIAAVSSARAQTQDPNAAPARQPTNKFIVRGCLTGSNLTDIEPTNPPVKLPEKLRVRSIRMIRDQVKALDGHQVELTGSLFGVPGVEQGILISDSDAVKVYLGGGDPNLGQDLVVQRNDPPTIRATMIKDLAQACPSKTSPRH
jgi:hypothetical protein